MSRRVKIWGRKTLAALRATLGDACVACGTSEDLEFDCIVPQGHHHHTLSTDGRATFYRRQVANANLQLLCRDCHRLKTRIDIRRTEAHARRAWQCKIGDDYGGHRISVDHTANGFNAELADVREHHATAAE